MAKRAPIDTAVYQQIRDLPEDFHEAGPISGAVLDAMLRHVEQADSDIRRSAETGCGKSTLLLSWLSAGHEVFTLDAYGDVPCRSYREVRNSPLLRPETVSFILGPSQQSLPQHAFSAPIQLALIDGPHGFPFPQLEYYYLYPALDEGALLIIDDIHIPTIRWLNDFLMEDAMFDHVEIVENTSFFRRSAQPLFNPYGDDWWLQGYNAKRFNSDSGSGHSGRLQRLYEKVLGRLPGSKN
jgi:hypothetical protein